MTALVTGNLALLAGAPDGVKRVRDLILELAMSGRLITDSAGLVRTASGTDLAGPSKGAVEVVDEPFPLPASWQWQRLGRITSVLTDGEHLTPPRTSDRSQVPLVTAKNVRDGHIDLASTDFVERTVADRCWHRCRPQAGDILMVSVGATLGRLSILRHDQDMVIVRSVALFRPRGLSADYLALALRSPSLQGQIWSRVKQSAQPCLYLSQASLLVIPVPPVSEQDRIVAKVDELMALCDRLEAQQQGAEAAHSRLVQALLDSLTQARDADDFQASWRRLAGHFQVLFTTENSVDALKNAVMQAGVEGWLHQGAPRSAWRTATIDTFCTVQGGIQKTPLRAPARHHFPYLRVANVQRGRVDVAELERYELEADELARWRLNAGDLLIVEGNGSANEIGRCAIWRGEVDDCVYQNHLMRVRPTAGDDVEYLSLYLNAPVGTAHMRRLAITTSGLFNLSVGKIRSIPIELPPQDDQPRIVAKVTELLALCDQLKARIAAARAKQAQLAEALVVQAVAA